MSIMKCPCGGKYVFVADEDATELPPSFTARYLYCGSCNQYDWREADELGLEDWPDEQAFSSTYT